MCIVSAWRKNVSLRFIRIGFFFFVLLLAPVLHATANWTILFFAQANNNLAPFALKNFSDMAQIGSSEQINAVVQWYQVSQPGIWRYKIEKGKMVLDECNAQNADGCSAQELIDAMSWAVRKYPAEHYALVLWDHGLGILDPVWRIQHPSYRTNRLGFNDAMVRANPRIQIDGLTMDGSITFTKSIESAPAAGSDQRGILFNEKTKTYMNNKNLSYALTTIKTQVLKNKPLDLLGMDACLMAMVEISYLARHCAQFLVASQEIELAHGWNYLSLLPLFTAAGATTQQIAQGIVHAYGAYYREKTQIYTQSAINLGSIEAIKDGLNTVITLCREYKKCGNGGEIDVVAKQARFGCLQLSTPNYVDLHSFLTEFSNSLGVIHPRGGWKQNNILQQLKTALVMCAKLIEQTVIANSAGKTLARAKGLSIYFPTGKVDLTYQTTDFAQESLWVSFLKDLYEQ